MTEPVVIGNCTLYLGDCLEILPTLAAGSVDAVITDPPYGINFSGASWKDKPEEYPELMKFIISEANRITDGAKAFWQALQNIDKWGTWFDFEYRLIAICKGFVQYRPTPIQWSFDPVIVWGKIDKEPSVYHKDYFIQSKAPFGANRESIDHPSPRPLEAMLYLLEILTNQKNTILDPFTGSGTTGIAAIQTGRKFIGIEIEERYFDIACKRIEKANQQIRMEL